MSDDGCHAFSRYMLHTFIDVILVLQSHWSGAVPTTASSVPALAPPPEAPSTSSASAGGSGAARPAQSKCNWTEHTSPDGYKYYYNSVTGESRVRWF